LINIAVLGCGHWGGNYLRLGSAAEGVRLVACADASQERVAAVRRMYPEVEASTSASDILARDDIQAVVIATPTETHYLLARQALESGKDVLCEKPLTASVGEAAELVRISQDRNRILMTGHIFLFNPGIRKVRDCITAGECGKPCYLHSVRTNLGPFRRDVNVVWDLAPHDISIFSYLLGAQPFRVWAKGESFLQPGIEDVAFITLAYPDKVLGHMHVSWLEPRKVRQITVIGDKKMVGWDDLDPVGPVRVYDKSVGRDRFYDNFGEFCLLAREGDITIPRVTLGEPLKAEFAHFLDCVTTRKAPVTDGANGLQVVKVLAAIQRSMQQDGLPQEVDA